MNKNRILSAVLALALAFSLAACGEKQTAPSPMQSDPAARPLAIEARYPEQKQFPDAKSFTAANGEMDWDAYSEAESAWAEDKSAHEAAWEKLPAGALDGFLTAGLPAFLNGAAGENMVLSPLNLYMALAMSAELCDGESRAQLLALLGADSIETLRERAGALWNAVYCDDGASKCVLAGSLWLSSGLTPREETLRALAENYYASSYAGDMGDPEFRAKLRAWLNEQTGGQLEDAAENVSLSPETVIELLATVYFRAKWFSPFDASNTAPDVFHAQDGDVECDFMHDEWAEFFAYRGAHFTAVQRGLEMAGDMWFLLPNEGVSPEALLSDPEALAFLLSGTSEQAEWYGGRLTLPKFDVTSNLELSGALRSLGVTDLFDASRADLSPVTDTAGISLSEVQHAARVTMDEEGVTATAFTAMGYGAGGPEFEMDFTLDRPFLFMITTGTAPLFVGVVNHP